MNQELVEKLYEYLRMSRAETMAILKMLSAAHVSPELHRLAVEEFTAVSARVDALAKDLEIKLGVEWLIEESRGPF